MVLVKSKECSETCQYFLLDYSIYVDVGEQFFNKYQVTTSFQALPTTTLLCIDDRCGS